jgi:predicted Zn-ribbon and HTH transcriptional regulator
MKDEIFIPVLKEEDFVAANLRRDKYSLLRDKQALEFNVAIATRLLAKEVNHFKCEKCGKEFAIDINMEGISTCPECE